MSQTKPPAQLIPIVDGWGHGHIFPRRDKRRERCGNVAFCGHCRWDLAFRDVLSNGDDRQHLGAITGAPGKPSARPAWHNYTDPRDPDLLFRMRGTYVMGAYLRRWPDPC